jgi:hypothetical protein
MDAIKEVNKWLSSKLDMKDLGAKNFILGMEIKSDRVASKIWLNEKNYIETVLKCFNIQNNKPVKVPFPIGERLTVEQFPKSQEEIEGVERVPNASVVGSFMYSMVLT